VIVRDILPGIYEYQDYPIRYSISKILKCVVATICISAYDGDLYQKKKGLYFMIIDYDAHRVQTLTAEMIAVDVFKALEGLHCNLNSALRRSLEQKLEDDFDTSIIKFVVNIRAEFEHYWFAWPEYGRFTQTTWQPPEHNNLCTCFNHSRLMINAQGGLRIILYSNYDACIMNVSFAC